MYVHDVQNVCCQSASRFNKKFFFYFAVENFEFGIFSYSEDTFLSNFGLIADVHAWSFFTSFQK
jgi:hypothetical protein